MLTLALPIQRDAKDEIQGTASSVKPGAMLSERAMRGMDITIAICALFLFAPLMVIVAIAMKLLDPGPILFRHTRIGRGGQSFECLKFRSMVVDSRERLEALLASSPAAREEWARTHKLRHDPRITALGRFLRKSSIDELPQLFNILRGEMSIVGPRPIVISEVCRYGKYFNTYTQVRPGLTGLWQVSGRNDTTYRRRVAMDVIYVRRRSLRLNMNIVAKTVPAVFSGTGCS